MPLSLTLVPRTAYRDPVEPVSTGAACPRTAAKTSRTRARTGCSSWVGGASRTRGPNKTRHRVQTRSENRQSSFTPTPGDQTREQAYVPAEQPSSSQDAWFPPADADPRRSRHLGVAPSQGPRPPGCL